MLIKVHYGKDSVRTFNYSLEHLIELLSIPSANKITIIEMVEDGITNN